MNNGGINRTTDVKTASSLARLIYLYSDVRIRDQSRDALVTRNV
jgi:hypothetical protein